MKDDTISRQAAITAIQNAYCDTEGGEDKCAVWKNVGLTNALHIMQDLPSAQPDEEKISDSLYEVYRLTCSQLGTGGVSVLKYYIAEIWREIYG